MYKRYIFLFIGIYLLVILGFGLATYIRLLR